MIVKIKKLSELAILPTQNVEGDAGWDLYSTEDYILKPLERKVFHSQIAVAIPQGYYGRIADRSGNALKKGLHVMGGVIDSTYRGSIGAILLNTNAWQGDGYVDLYRESNMFHSIVKKYPDKFIEIKKGDKIAQIIF